MIRTPLAIAAVILAAIQPTISKQPAKSATAVPAKPAVPEKHSTPAIPEPAPEAAVTATPTPGVTRAGTGRITFAQCNVDGPYIAMTFDDGPHGSQTPRVLKLLKERNLKATFFVCGNNVAQNPEVAKQIVEEGHEIANHSWNHPQLTKLPEGSVREQLQKTHDVVKQTTGVTMTLMRPPYGAFTTAQRSWSHATWGYKCILWDVDSLDWQHRNPGKTESNILAHTKAGSIVLCHDIHKTTIDAMAATFDGLQKKGFKFVTVSELIAMHKEGATPAAKPKTAASLTPAEGARAATSLEDIGAQPATEAR